jgi:DNA polymerase elongation subunit (family B)
MYPTILKAMNIGADTVRLTSSGEKPNAWIWLKKLPKEFFSRRDVKWREITSEERYADKGFMLGVKIDRSPGMVSLSMTGIMNVIARVKQELKDALEKNDEVEITRLKMMYQSLKGARNAGTHGILAAPMVSGRQFNLWGGAAITTKGQIILSDTLQYLEEQGIRVVYGDTDGIYLGCSQSAYVLPDYANALGLPPEENGRWLTKPDDAFQAIQECNNKWQQELEYPEFELEPEVHDAMIFVKHKNYLIFDHQDKCIKMTTKGNNFKGSDKANIARKILHEIMMKVLQENPSWTDEETVRTKIKNALLEKTQEILQDLDLSKVELEDLTLIQSVQPAKRYKQNQDGSISTFGRRAEALEQVLGYPIKSRIKVRFVVTKHPLPGITKPSKSGVKPIDYMYPVDLLKDPKDIDLEWYKKMIENYIQGAFGLSNIAMTEQTGLDAWM